MVEDCPTESRVAQMAVLGEVMETSGKNGTLEKRAESRSVNPLGPLTPLVAVGTTGRLGTWDVCGRGRDGQRCQPLCAAGDAAPRAAVLSE